MSRIDVKSERIVDGGYVVSAHVKDWDLLQSFPHKIVQDIVDTIVTRFIEENGVMIMKLVKDRELISIALGKEIQERVKKYIFEQDEKEKERRPK